MPLPHLTPSPILSRVTAVLFILVLMWGLIISNCCKKIQCNKIKKQRKSIATLFCRFSETLIYLFTFWPTWCNRKWEKTLAKIYKGSTTRRPTGVPKSGGVDFSNKPGSLCSLILCQWATPELRFDDLTRMLLIDSQICSFPDCTSYSLIIFPARNNNNVHSFGRHVALQAEKAG